LALTGLNVIPYEKDELPSAALGWFGGGNISVSSSDRTGKKVTEPFFEVRGDIVRYRDRGSAALLHGRSGVLRLGLPPEPLASQAYRAFKQTVQKRYKL
jgi:putative peptide zinc metalloprotease protein